MKKPETQRQAFNRELRGKLAIHVSPTDLDWWWQSLECTMFRAGVRYGRKIERLKGERK